MELPSVHSAERSVIACALCDPQLIPLADVVPEDFIDLRLRKVWDAAVRALDEGRDVEPVYLHSVTGVSESLLWDLASAKLTGEGISHYGAIVKRASIERRVLVALSKALNTREHQAEARLAYFYDLATEIGPQVDNHGRSLPEYIEDVATKVQEAHTAGGMEPGIPTGLKSLDRVTGGLPRGVVSIVAGRPSDGKSALVAQVARTMAASGERVDVYSLEDTGDSFSRRIIAQASRLDLRRLASGSISDEEMGNLRGTVEQLKSETKTFHLCDELPRSLGKLALIIRAGIARRGTTVVIVDYFQLLRDPSSRRGTPVHEQLTQASLTLKRIAKNTGVAMVLASQANRDASKDEAPQLHHLKGTGGLEQDCHVCIMLERLVHPDLGNATIAHVRKNKNGPIGSIPFRFHKESVLFEDMPELELMRWRKAMSS